MKGNAKRQENRKASTYEKSFIVWHAQQREKWELTSLEIPSGFKYFCFNVVNVNSFVSSSTQKWCTFYSFVEESMTSCTIKKFLLVILLLISTTYWAETKICVLKVTTVTKCLFIQFRKECLFFCGYRAKDYGNIFNTHSHTHMHTYIWVIIKATSRYSVLSPKKAEQGLVKYFAATFIAIWPFPNYIVL